MTPSVPQRLPPNVLERRPRRRFKQASGTSSTLSSQTTTSSSTPQDAPTNLADLSILIAVAVWYALGIVSISTTKILLVQGTPPLLLTVQQLLIGFTVLRGFISWNQEQQDEKKNEHPAGEDEEYGATNPASNITKDTTITTTTYHPIQLWQEAPYLVAAGLFFTLGFLATNLGFQASSASFVETIKAAEPLTSAGLAVGFGLESLNVMEWASLATLIIGVLASTLANSQSSAAAATLQESLVSCGIVMASNLCFSLRGLYQKWFLQKHSGSNPRAEELQVQMQQLGVWVLIGPAIVGYGKWGALHLIQKGISIHYVGLALINGLAFTSYNLASTWLLNRITMVHHAALNCIRRIFAIVATSIIFRIPMTFLGIAGVLVSMAGFLSFTRAKAAKSKPKRGRKVRERRESSVPLSGNSIDMQNSVDVTTIPSGMASKER